MPRGGENLYKLNEHLDNIKRTSGLGKQPHKTKISSLRLSTDFYKQSKPGIYSLYLNSPLRDKGQNYVQGSEVIDPVFDSAGMIGSPSMVISPKLLENHTQSLILEEPIYNED